MSTSPANLAITIDIEFVGDVLHMFDDLLFGHAFLFEDHEVLPSSRLNVR